MNTRSQIILILLIGMTINAQNQNDMIMFWDQLDAVSTIESSDNHLITAAILKNNQNLMRISKLRMGWRISCLHKYR